MKTSWPEPVERVAAFLLRAGAEARLEELGAPAGDARAASEAAGCALEQIATSHVLLCDEQPVVVLVPGDRRVDLAKIAHAAGAREARRARPDEVVGATGFVSDCVSPFPLPRAVGHVFVDRTLLAQPRVWVGAGSPSHLTAIRPAELLRLTRGESMDALSEGTYDDVPGDARRGDATR